MYQYALKDPDTAYVSNNLVVPKSGINLAPFKSALTFVYGEEEVFDEETGQLLTTRASELKLWDETEHHLIVPREFLRPEGWHQFRFEFVDLRPTDYEATGVKDSITLRDQTQMDAFAALCHHYSGTLNLACGKGKTVLSLKLAAHLGVPTIIVVNTTALLEQWKKEILKFLDVHVGVVQGEEADWEHSPIVIAMVHTLARRREEWPWKFRRRFGLVIYDEGHHMSAPVFVRSADLFFGRRYSLTATAQRIDGLEAVYQHHLGPIIYSDLEQELIPTTFFHNLKWEFDLRYKPLVTDKHGDFNLPRIRTHIGELDWRNELIYQDLLSDMRAGRKILVLSHSVDHCTRMYEKLDRAVDVIASVITGATPQGDRMRLLSDCNPVIGTFQLAREGLDKPSLDTLYVLTPFSSPNDLQQAWGRIQRQYEGKLPPLVRVYVDHAFDQCVKSARNLKSHLNRMRYPYKNRNIQPEVT